jgi:hypothetical protein
MKKEKKERTGKRAKKTKERKVKTILQRNSKSKSHQSMKYPFGA